MTRKIVAGVPPSAAKPPPNVPPPSQPTALPPNATVISKAAATKKKREEKAAKKAAAAKEASDAKAGQTNNGGKGTKKTKSPDDQLKAGEAPTTEMSKSGKPTRKRKAQDDQAEVDAMVATAEVTLSTNAAAMTQGPKPKKKKKDTSAVDAALVAAENEADKDDTGLSTANAQAIAKLVADKAQLQKELDEAKAREAARTQNADEDSATKRPKGSAGDLRPGKGFTLMMVVMKSTEDWAYQEWDGYLKDLREFADLIHLDINLWWNQQDMVKVGQIIKLMQAKHARLCEENFPGGWPICEMIKGFARNKRKSNKAATKKKQAVLDGTAPPKTRKKRGGKKKVPVAMEQEDSSASVNPEPTRVNEHKTAPEPSRAGTSKAVIHQSSGPAVEGDFDDLEKQLMEEDPEAGDEDEGDEDGDDGRDVGALTQAPEPAISGSDYESDSDSSSSSSEDED